MRLEENDNSKSAHQDWTNVIGLSEVIQNLKNDTGISYGIGDVFDRLFYDNLVAAISRVQLNNRGMVTASDEIDVFPQAKFTVKKNQVIDMNLIEVITIRDFYREAS